MLSEDDMKLALAKNGKEYVQIRGDSRLLDMVTEADVKDFFKDIDIDGVRFPFSLYFIVHLT